MSDKVKIVIETDAGRSEQVLKNVQKGLKGVSTGSKKTSKGMLEMSRDVGLTLDAFTNLAGKALQAGKAMYGLAKEAANLSEARLYLQTFAAEIGISFAQLDKDTSKATRGLVDNLTLIRMNHKALKLGVATDTKDIARLWEIADSVGDEFGQSMEQTFSQMVTAISEGNSRMLLKLGILPESFKRVSTAAGITEKRVELLNEVFKQAGPLTDKLAAKGDTAADKFQRFDIAVKDLKLGMGEFMSEAMTPTLDMINKDLIPALKTTIKLWEEWAGLNKRYSGQGAAGTLGKLAEEKSQAAARLKEINEFRVSKSYKKANTDYGLYYDFFKDARKANIEHSSFAKVSDVKNSLEDERNKLKLQLQYYDVTMKKLKATAADNRELEKSKETTNEIIKAMEDAVSSTKKIKSQSIGSISLESFGEFENILKDVENIYSDLDKDMGSFFDEVNEGVDELVEANKETQRLKEAWEDLDGAIQGVFTGFDFTKAQKSLTPDKAISGMMNMFGAGGLVNATGTNFDLEKSEKENLSNIIADAITQGFANADFTDFTQTLGSILSNVLSKSVSSKFPVIGDSGSIDWGNLGINTAVSAGMNWLQSDGRPFGSYVEHGEERIQQSADLKTNITNEYLQTFKTELLPFLNQLTADGIANSRNSIGGVSVGYSKNTSGDPWMSGLFAKNTNTYELIDNGGSASLAELTKWNEIGEDYSKQQEQINTLLSARGYSYDALKIKADAYNTTVESLWFKMDERSLKWTDGYGETIDLSDDMFALRTTNEELKRQLGMANASRTNFANQAFTSYSPWVSTVPLAYGFDGVPDGATYPGKTSALSTDQIYDAMYDNSMNYQDRNASPYMLDMIKEAGSGKFDLASLNITDSEAYSEKYAEFLDKQIETYAEVMEREESIYNDLTKSFEERSAALQEFEASQEAYYQAKLNQISEEQRKQDELQQKQDEARATQISSALSLVGELNTREGKIVILQGNNATDAMQTIKEAIAGENPDAAALIDTMIKQEKDRALWGS